MGFGIPAAIAAKLTRPGIPVCAVVGGASVVGEGCFVGLNATVGHGVTIGDYSFLGAGTRVLSTAPAKSVFIERDTAKFRLDSDDFLKITKLG